MVDLPSEMKGRGESV